VARENDVLDRHGERNDQYGVFLARQPEQSCNQARCHEQKAMRLTGGQYQPATDEDDQTTQNK
jgi:hypothetical protein